MTKQFLYFVLVIIFSITYLYDQEIRGVFLSFGDKFKGGLYSKLDTLNSILDTHYNQVDRIKQLKIENAILQKNVTQNIFLQYKLNNLNRSLQLNTITQDSYNVRLLSYMNMKNNNKFWVEFNGFKKNKTYGLIQNNHAVGIITAHNGRALAILNQDSQCNFGVYIGTYNTLGITKGYVNSKLVINYISNESEISVGDSVITNGIDNIFLPGYKVGKVEKIEQDIGFKRALVSVSHKVDKSLLFQVVVPN